MPTPTLHNTRATHESAPRPVRLLVSVRNAAEALAALEGGADIIDVKDPSRGPLGMASARAIEMVVDAVNGLAPVSVALGELADEPDVAPLTSIARSGIAFAKVGLRGQRNKRWRKRLTSLHRQLPHVRPVVVLYSDCLGGSSDVRCPEMDALVRWALANEAAGVLMDTFTKNGRGLFGGTNHSYSSAQERLEWETSFVADYVTHARSAGLMIALAGQLAGPTLMRALSLRPDVIAVRGAACVGDDRNARVDAARVRAIKSVIEASNLGTSHQRSARRAG